MTTDAVDLDRRLEDLFGEGLVRVRIDPCHFAAFRSHYSDPREGIDAEKLLEYYISYNWLRLDASDVFVDVAAQNCPFASFVRDTIGCRVYRQDLYYLRPGIHGEDVGGDATALPFPDGFLSKLALHNSFEHFEGDSDIRFLREAARVLRPQGKVCIVPLFVGPKSRVETEAGWIDEHGKKHLWGVGARFARTYDPASLEERVLKNCEDFEMTAYLVENAPEIDAGCYLRYFLLLEKRGELGAVGRAGGLSENGFSAAARRLLRRGHAQVSFWARRLARSTRLGQSR
jgi:SAM-dependent methyltransferase